MKKGIRTTALWTLAAAVALGSAAPCFAAGTVGLSSNPSLLKVFRVFGDDDQANDSGTGARSPRRSKASKGRKRGRSVRPQLAPTTPSSEEETGILDLIDPNATSAVAPAAQKNAPRAQSPLRGRPCPGVTPGEEPCR